MEILSNYRIKLEEKNIYSGLIGKFLTQKIPVFYLLNLKNISLYYGIEYDGDQPSEIELSKIYYKNHNNILNYCIIFLFLLLIYIIRKNRFKKIEK